MSNSLKAILGTLLAFALMALIVFEIKTGFSMIGERKTNETSAFIEAAKSFGMNSVEIEEISVYDEIPEPEEEGDTIRLKDTNVRVKINGKQSAKQTESLNQITYKSLTNKISETITLEEKTSGIADLRNAVTSFWYGTPSELLTAYGMASDDSEIEYYQQSYKTGNIPVIFNIRTNTYYMFVDCDKTFIVISCDEPFMVTDGVVTAKYGDPKKDVMKSHTYSKYEEFAAENTRRELLEKAEVEDTENPYKEGDVIGTSDTYTSKKDNQMRDQLVSYTKFEWKEDGTCKNTTTKIDCTSEEAKKSEWVLTQTTYSYSHAGLTLSNLSAKRSSTEFSLSGNINNTLDAERPYVIVVKFMGENDALLGLKVIDKRNKPLEKKGVATFETTATSEKDKIDTAKIVAVQFELY